MSSPTPSPWDQELADRFGRFSQPYLARAATPQARRAVQLRIDHTRRVAAVARTLAGRLGLDAAETDLTVTLAWCHDLGRFAQYAQLGAYDDSGLDHGRLSADLAGADPAWLAGVPAGERLACVEALALHNRFLPPERHANRWLALLQDCDKIDIIRLLCQEIGAVPPAGRTALPGTTRVPAADPRFIQALATGRPTSLRGVSTDLEATLCLLSWLDDLWHPPAVAMLVEDGTAAALVRLAQHYAPAAELAAEALERHRGCARCA